MSELNKGDRWLFGGSLALLVLLFLFSLCLGRYPLSLRDLFLVLQGRGAPTQRLIFFGIRLPRTLIALFGGAVLAFTGGIFQVLFRNPLATPDVMGITAGASFGAAAGILWGGSFPLAVPVFAFFGAMAAIVLVLLLSELSGRRDIVTYLVSGIIVSALARGALMLLKYLADPERELAAIEFWTMGSLAKVTAKDLLPTLLPLIAGTVLLLFLGFRILILGLSEDEAQSLGVDAKATRRRIILLVTVLVSTLTALTGPIGFVAIMAPHMARRLCRKGGFAPVVLSCLLGAMLLLAADLAARSLSSHEMPISIFTTLMGAPYLAWILIGRNHGTL